MKTTKGGKKIFENGGALGLKEIKGGKITKEPGAKPKPHEIETAKVLVHHGDVKFLKESEIPEVHTPDIEWLGMRWELKSPEGNGRWTIDTNISRATNQSENIIIDLQYCGLNKQKAVRDIVHQAKFNKHIKHICYIDKYRNLFDIL